MIATIRLGWTFSSPLRFSEIKSKLDAASEKPWVVGDSEHLGDYLGGRLTEEAIARIYTTQEGFAVNLRFTSLDGPAKAQLEAAERKLLSEILPLIEAYEILESDPLE
jgi:hypothetical protein